MTVFDDAYEYFKANPDELAYMWTRFNWAYPPPKPFLEFVFHGDQYVAWYEDRDEPPDRTRKVKVNVSKLNVRSGPGTEYAIVGALLFNDVVDVFDRPAQNGWLQLSPAQPERWISAQYVVAV